MTACILVYASLVVTDSAESGFGVFADAVSLRAVCFEIVLKYNRRNLHIKQLVNKEFGDFLTFCGLFAFDCADELVGGISNGFENTLYEYTEWCLTSLIL